MDNRFSRQEIVLLEEILEGRVGEIGLAIRQTPNPEVKEALRSRRKLLRRILDKLVGEHAVAESQYDCTISPLP